MLIFLKIRYSALIVIVIALAGCIEENPNLVNPPPHTETVRVRFLNLSADKSAKKLSLDNMAFTDLTAYGKVSKAIKPPVDSSNILILSDNGILLQKTRYKMRFIRETYYTVFYMPLKGDTVSASTDTVFMISTLSGLTKKNKTSFIKLFNAADDLYSTYSLNIGCPSGPSLAAGIAYGRSGIINEIRSDTVAVSLTKSTPGSDPESKLYKIYLEEGKQYSIITARNEFGEEKAYLLSDEDLTENALKELTPVTDRNTYLRVANFSGQDVRLIKDPDIEISGDTPAGWISEYSEFEVCKTTAMDYVAAYIGSDKKSMDSISLEVLEKYTAFVFDSEDGDAGLTVITGPVFTGEDMKGKAIVRVINASSGHSATPLTLSLAARESKEKPAFYTTGEYIATDLYYRTKSGAKIITAGVAPLTLYTSTNPAKLLTTALANFEEGHRYIITITSGASGEALLTIIDEETGPAQIEKLPQGVFVQVVNATANSMAMAVSMAPVLANASVPASGSLATVLPEGTGRFEANGGSLDFDAHKGSRYLIIAAGISGSPDNFFIKTTPTDFAANNYLRRVVNVSQSIQALSVRQDSDSGFVVSSASGMGYKQITEYETSTNERKNSIFFIDENNIDHNTGRPQILLRVDDISYSFGKKYTILFCGGKTGKDLNEDGFDDGYYSIILQEF